MKTWIGLLLFSTVLITGCNNRRVSLRPAPGARMTAQDDAVDAIESGVRALVHLHEWSGNPVELKSLVTPLRVTIVNGSDHSLRLLWSEFYLTTSNGVKYNAIPPDKIVSSNAIRIDNLPTQEMIDAAIPQGILARQSRVSGFLYFPRLDESLNGITFHVSLWSEKEGLKFGEIAIPFVLQ